MAPTGIAGIHAGMNIVMDMGITMDITAITIAEATFPLGHVLALRSLAHHHLRYLLLRRLLHRRFSLHLRRLFSLLSSSRLRRLRRPLSVEAP